MIARVLFDLLVHIQPPPYPTNQLESSTQTSHCLLSPIHHHYHTSETIGECKNNRTPREASRTPRDTVQEADRDPGGGGLRAKRKIFSAPVFRFSAVPSRVESSGSGRDRRMWKEKYGMGAVAQKCLKTNTWLRGGGHIVKANQEQFFCKNSNFYNLTLRR